MYPKQHSSVSEYEVDDDLVLYDPRNDNAHILNGTAAVVWWLCDGEHTPEQIASELAGLYELNPATVMTDVQTALASLEKARLVTWSDKKAQEA
jgi:hypothetical protein